MPDYDPLLTQQLLRSAEAHKQLPGGDLTTAIAAQLKLADSEIGIAREKVRQVDDSLQRMKRQRDAELDEIRQIREGAPAPEAGLRLPRGRRLSAPPAPAAQSPAVPQGDPIYINPYLAGAQVEAPPPIVEEPKAPRKTKKAK